MSLVTVELTGVQGVLGAQQRAGTDDVDHTPGVSAHFLHQHGEVVDLSLQVGDERGLDVEQRGGLGVLSLQITEALLLGRVQPRLLFTLTIMEEKKNHVEHGNVKSHKRQEGQTAYNVKG